MKRCRALFLIAAAALAVCLCVGNARAEEAEAWHTRFYGRYLTENTQRLSLRGVQLGSTAELEEKLPHMPQLRLVLLGDCGLPEHRLMAMAARWPNVHFVWDMHIGDAVFSTDAAEIDLTGIPLKSTAMIERRIPYLFNAQKIILSGCGLPSAQLDALNRRHPEVQIVWTVQLGSMKVRTDETTFIPVKYRKRVSTKDLEEFKYCTDMVAIDIGHMWVHNCDWAAYMPNLEYLILGETYITDITPLQGLKKLKFLELFTINVDDYTPLLGCTGLEDLNLGLTYGQPEVIAQMTWLKNLWWCDANGYDDPARREAVAEMQEALKDTTIKIYINHPTASGWRKLPNYFAMRDTLGMFYME